MVILLLASSLGACSHERKPEKPEEPAPVPEQPAREPTFESIAPPSELMEKLRANLPSPVDTDAERQAIAEIEQELGAFQYVPSSEVAILAEPEEPMGASFAADMAMTDERLTQIFSGAVVVGCGLRPCVHYGDFDGDGHRDMAVQVVEKANSQAGIVFLLANRMYAVLGAGRASEVGADLLWVMSWRSVPAGPVGGTAAALILDGTTEQASVQLGAPRGDGSVEVVTRWIVSPPPPIE
jgi:hypothetical protein